MVIIDYFPLHTAFRDEIWNQTKLFGIFFNWFFASKIEAQFPIFLLASYFGERIGMYFAWLTFYTTWLLYLSIPGIILSLCQLFTLSIDQYLIPIYSLIASLWITLMNQAWRRREAELAHAWNMTNFRKRSKERTEYKYEYIIDKETNEVIKKSITYSKIRTIAFTVPTILFGLTLIIAAFVMFRIWSNLSSSSMNNMVAGAVYGAAIFGFTYLYIYLASILTNLENHRYEDQWQDSYSFKIFALQFVNCYISLFAIAFYDFDLSNLAYTVGIVFIVYQFLTHIGQLTIFNWFDLWKTYMFHKKLAGDKTFPVEPGRRERNIHLEMSYLKTYSVDPIFDYSEMVIQIGYLSMFSSVFPLSPLLAFFRNVWEINGNFLLSLR